MSGPGFIYSSISIDAHPSASHAALTPSSRTELAQSVGQSGEVRDSSGLVITLTAPSDRRCSCSPGLVLGVTNTIDEVAFEPRFMPMTVQVSEYLVIVEPSSLRAENRWQSAPARSNHAQVHAPPHTSRPRCGPPASRSFAARELPRCERETPPQPPAQRPSSRCTPSAWSRASRLAPHRTPTAKRARTLAGAPGRAGTPAPVHEAPAARSRRPLQSPAQARRRRWRRRRLSVPPAM